MTLYTRPLPPTDFSIQEYGKPPEKKEDTESLKGTGLTNFCKLGSMSTCGVATGKKWKDHVTCKFAVKAGYSDRCTDFRFDEYCTCLKAQLAAENLTGVEPQMYMA